jgi:uncharacterized protein YhaN
MQEKRSRIEEARSVSVIVTKETERLERIADLQRQEKQSLNSILHSLTDQRQKSLRHQEIENSNILLQMTTVHDSMKELRAAVKAKEEKCAKVEHDSQFSTPKRAWMPSRTTWH